MKNLSIIRIISLIIVTLLVISGIAVAEGAESADIEFITTETEDGFVTLELAIKNAAFMGVQTALEYDTGVLMPINKSGVKANSFRDFAERPEAALCFNTIGLELDAQNGYFGFTCYIMPGAEDDNINEKNEYVAGGEGVTIYKFRFKRIAEGDCGFAIITSKETDFVAAVEPGIYIMDRDNGHLEANISFIYEDKEPQQSVVAPKPSVKPEDEKPEEPVFTDEDRKKDVICLQIGKNLTVTYGKKKAIDEANNLVVPYIKNDRTLVPLRYIAETLGAEVLWEEGWDGCIIKKDGTEIKITFGSADFTVNGKTVTYEAPIEVVHDRTMVPVRFISENFGCDVYWNELNSAVVISPLNNPWIESREAEKIALGEMLASFLPVMQ